MSALKEEVSETFRRFVAAQKGRDEAELAPLLLEGPEFLWVTTSAVTIWGRDAALARFRANWEKQWHLDPDLAALRIVEISPGVALLHVPLRFTFAPHGEQAIPTSIKWSGVFRRVEDRWIIAAILLATVL
ncbi:MAG: nuclear transport factor 2 family protein [Alphaproteobacteria bacterium]